MLKPTVHPRVCGELSRHFGRGSQPTGSSPRVRGTRETTCAGNASSPVHPRVCGELVMPTDLEARNYRFIPACAGNSAVSGHVRSNADGSSPRVRGTRAET